MKILKDTLHGFLFEVLGLKDEASNAMEGNHLHDAVQILIDLRNNARVNKDFETSDRIRDELLKAGIQLKDGKEGTTFSVV